MRAELVMSMCERIRARGMNGVFMTNGLVFKEDYYLRLARVGWASLVFSLDGPSAEINDTIRSKGSFARATETMRKIKDARDRNGFTAPTYGIHATLTALNYDKLDQLAELAHELGCYSIGTDHLTDAGPHCEPFRLTQEQKAALPEHVHRAMERANQLGLSNYFSNVLDERAYRRPQPLKDAEGLLHAVCFEPWLSVAVHADGRVGPCCVYWEEQAASLMDSSLREIWLGPHLQSVRDDVLAGRLPGYCAKCSPAPPALGARDSLLRQELASAKALDDVGTAQRALFLLKKAFASVKRNGVRGAIHRGREWLQIHRNR